jgi:hypothetical protein
MAKRRRQKEKQRSTKHTYKTKDRVTRTQLKPGGELRGSLKTAKILHRTPFMARGTRYNIM